MKKIILIFTVATLSASFISSICSIPLIAAAHAGDLTVVVDNIKSEQGNIRIALFNSAKDFPKLLTSGQTMAAKMGSVTFSFKDLPAGQFALSAFHDQNGNQKLDTNFVGKPVEPYGFSRDARGTFGPPSFEEAVLQIDENLKTITISVK